MAPVAAQVDLLVPKVFG